MTQHVYGSGPCTTMLGFDTVEVWFSSLMNPLLWWKHREKTEKTWWILVYYDELWWWIMMVNYDEHPLWLWLIMMNYGELLYSALVRHSLKLSSSASLRGSDKSTIQSDASPFSPLTSHLFRPSLTGVSWANGFWMFLIRLVACNPGFMARVMMSWSSLWIVRFQTFPNHTDLQVGPHLVAAHQPIWEMLGWQIQWV